MRPTALAAIAFACAISTANVAAAQDGSAANFYGTLGYTQNEDLNVGAIQGRLGARFGAYLGVEGQVSAGVKSHTLDIPASPPISVKTSLSHEAALFGVGYLPLSPNADLFARVGYGTTRLKVSGLGASGHQNLESWGFGAGAQYFFDGKNGVRVEYLRQDFESPFPSSDAWAVAYTRRF